MRGAVLAILFTNQFFQTLEEEDLLEQFFHYFEAEKQYLQEVIKASKPNILVYGMSGVGKSSLINRMFGREIGIVGIFMHIPSLLFPPKTGQIRVPTTQSFELYSHEDLTVNIYEAKGLELGQNESNMQKTTEFFEELQRQKKPIHMVRTTK